MNLARYSILLLALTAIGHSAVPSVDTKAALKSVASSEAFRSSVRQVFSAFSPPQQSAVKSSLSAMADGRVLQASVPAFDALVAKALAEMIITDLPDGENKTAIKSVVTSGDLYGLLAFLTPGVDTGPDDTVPLITADTRLTKKQKKALEKRFVGTAWSVPSDTRDFAEYYFQRDGTAVRLNGPSGSQWGRVFPWIVRENGIVQVGGPGQVQTYWFWFGSPETGDFGSAQVTKEGDIIPPARTPIRLLPNKKLPKYSDKQP